MLGTVKKIGTGLTLKVKDLFTSAESQVYVEDLRKVMVYKDGRKFRYPKNYDQIKEFGKIIEQKDNEGDSVYKLVYGENKFNLALAGEVDNKSYFTINFLVSKDRREINDYHGFYEPFKFSKIDLEQHLPIFEAIKTKDSQYPFELTNSRMLAKKGCSINDTTGEVDEKDRDKKGRNGELLYTSDYKKLSTHFSEIRDQNGNLELDKSLISVPIVFVTSLAKVCTKLLTSLPMKLGEYLISKQNPIAKSVGYLLFTPAIAVKNLANMGATILKAPILLLVANEKKYGDAYFTMWKYQLKGCWEEAKSDFNVIKDRERLKSEQKDPKSIVGTWDELNAAAKLKGTLNESSENIIDKSRELGIGGNFEKNLQNEVITGFENQKSSKTHVEREQNRKQEQSHMPPFN